MRILKIIGTFVALEFVAGLAIMGATALAASGQDAQFAQYENKISAFPAAGFMTFDGMMPGDSRTREVVLTNPSDDNVSYDMTVQAVNDDGKGLKDQLDMTVRAGNTTHEHASCESGGGAVLFGGDLDGASEGILAHRVLRAGDSDTLCITVVLPLETGNEFQGASTVATLNFFAVTLD